MSLRAKTGRLAVLVFAGALVPSFSTGREVDPDTPTIFVVGPAALTQDEDPRPDLERRDPAPTALVSSPRARAGTGLLLHRLSKGNRRIWRAIEEVVAASDAFGEPRSPTLRRLWDWAQASTHVLHIEMVSPSKVAFGVVGRFHVERVDPAGLRHVAVIRLCPRNIRYATVSRGPDSVVSFVRFEGLTDVERYAEVLAHELAHAKYFLGSPERVAELEAAQRTRADFLSGRERAIKRLPEELGRRVQESLAVLAATEAHAESVEAVVLRELSRPTSLPYRDGNAMSGAASNALIVRTVPNDALPRHPRGRVVRQRTRLAVRRGLPLAETNGGSSFGGGRKFAASAAGLMLAW